MGAGGASARLAWAVEQLDLQPHHHVLELGCGHGVAASLIAERLTAGGSVTALDRSVTMTAATSRRNADHVADGRVRVVTADVAAADLGDLRFDRVLAVHLPVLQRGDPSRELEGLADHLAAGGRLHVAFQPLDPAGLDGGIEAVRTRVERAGWVVTEVRTGSVDTGPVGCVVTVPG